MAIFGTGDDLFFKILKVPGQICLNQSVLLSVNCHVIYRLLAKKQQKDYIMDVFELSSAQYDLIRWEWIRSTQKINLT